MPVPSKKITPKNYLNRRAIYDVTHVHLPDTWEADNTDGKMAV
jgi:hypothetical protein